MQSFLATSCILSDCYQVCVLDLVSGVYSIMGQPILGVGNQQTKWNNTSLPSFLPPSFLVWPVSGFDHKPDPPPEENGGGRNLAGAWALQLCIISDESPSLSLQHKQKKFPCFSGFNAEVRAHLWYSQCGCPLSVLDVGWIPREVRKKVILGFRTWKSGP